MDKKKVLKYIGLTYLFSWTIQVIVSIFVVKNDSKLGLSVFQGGLAICMFAPMIATLIVNGNLKGMGWKPKFKGNIKWIFFSMLIPAVFTILGFVCFFAIYPELFSMDGSYLLKQIEATGLNTDEFQKSLGMINMDMKKLIIISLIQIIVEAPFVNMFLAIGEEAGWRGFLYPELKKGFGRVKTWLIGGLIWAAFHFPCMFIAGYEYGTKYMGAPILGPVVFTIFCIAIGILMEIIYDKTQCIWYPALLHGSINGAATMYQLVINANETDKLEKLMILGPAPNGAIAGIPFLILAIVMGIIALRSRED
ncbi:MAG: CPBP family intramembrane metalloprotease [Eubacterium sp.]|nr:CPBP family intramembrane metalloprotease [Eubacterium sp.]